MNFIKRIISTIRRDIADGGTAWEVLFRKAAFSTYQHQYELYALSKFYSKGRVLNVGAGRDNGRLGINVESMNIYKDKDNKPDWHASAEEGFPFEDGDFDCTMAMHLLEYVRDPIYTLTEMLRVTKRHGIICGTLPCAALNPIYNYWRDEEHKVAFSRFDFASFLSLNMFLNRNTIV